MKNYAVPHKIRIIHTFSENGTVYQISDHFYEKDPQKNTRDLSFKREGMPCFYLHSSVYLDPHIVEQPIYLIPQEIINKWSQMSPIKNALVMGCAGCTIPRFLVLSFPECKVVGVELSATQIDIAKKYFYVKEYDERFRIVQGDARKYFHVEPNELFDLIYIDLYEENRIVDCVFSPQFIEAQLKHLSFRALLVINLLDVLQNDVIKLVSQYSKFSWCSGSVVINEGRQFLIVSNTDRNWFRDFRKNLNDMLCMYEF